ncbi:dipeptide ABC transporter ATP-binding protein [Paenibacillus azoreducens]|uniref:ABC transporter ATP-binding protein n=1 Tax=Paenibacillus azoreducens TaxID=116718 RepID=UPI0039F4E5F8
MVENLVIKDLAVTFNTYAGEVQAVRGVSFQLKKGETLAIVGESGSGKSVMVKCIMRLIDKSIGSIKQGEVWFEGEDLLQKTEKQMQGIRGSYISIITQDPMTSLNPTMTVGNQIMECIRKHQRVSRSKAKREAIELLEMVGIPNPELRIKQYPHQFSGGMRQRVSIAIALACKPKILIADEPTTALDVTVQAQILELLKNLQSKLGMSIIFITHDLGVVAGLAERVIVMYAGKAVEVGTVDEIFYDPRHPYTWGLLGSMPGLHAEEGTLYSIPGTPPNMMSLPKGDAFAPRNKYSLKIDFMEEPPMFQISPTHYAATWLLHEHAPKISRPYVSPSQRELHLHDPDKAKTLQAAREKLVAVENLKKYFPLGKGQIHKAVDGLTFDIYKGETLGLVGESGCGKSTTGRTLIGLYTATSGKVLYGGENISGLNSLEKRQQMSRRMQMIFQDPYSTLNPRMTVADIIAEGVDIHRFAKDAGQRREFVYQLLEAVGLNRDHANRYPHEFSGGQRQRIGIARALAVSPEFIIADEPISALDVSVQAQVVNLLKHLQKEKGLTYLFIAHDLSMVKHISDRIAVMYRGRIVELADSAELYENPLHPYTRSLLSAIPVPDPVVERKRKRIVFDHAMYAKNDASRVFREVERGHWVACTDEGVEPALRQHHART